MKISYVAVLALAACSAPDRPEGQQAKMDERRAVENGLRHVVVFEGEAGQSFSLTDRMAHYNTPGVSVTVIENGAIAWSGAYGVLEQGGGAPVTEDTLFQAGSIAKPVTAFAVMRMFDSGLIDLDADIGTYLSSAELPEGAHTRDNPLTMRHLLNHTGGVTPGGYFGYEQGAQLPDDAQIVAGEAPANTDPIAVVSPPGEALIYSGPGYTLAELALQDVTGEAFAPLMTQWVFAPADLHEATFETPLPEERRANAARGHDSAGEMVEGGWRVHPEQAAAGLWATSSDLARFLIALHEAYQGENALLSEATARDFMTEQRDGHAYGWVVRGEEFLGHGGGTVGYRASMVFSPESGDGAVVLTNGDSGVQLTSEILRAASDVYGWTTFRPLSETRAEPAAETLAGLTGRFEFEGGIAVTVEFDGDALTAIFPNGDTYRLAPVGENRFIYPANATEVSFAESEDGLMLEVYGSHGVRRTD